MKKFEVSANMKKEMLADYKASLIQFFKKNEIEFNPEYKREKTDLPEIMIEAQLIEGSIVVGTKIRKNWLQKINGEDNPDKALKAFKTFTKKWFNENDTKWNEYFDMLEDEEEDKKDNDDDDDNDDDNNDDDKEDDSLEEMLKNVKVNVIDLGKAPKEKRKEILKEIIEKIRNK